MHVTSGLKNPITWGQYTEYISEATLKHPVQKMLWYPTAKARSSKWRATLAVHLFQLWPSYVLDLLRAVFSRKTKERLAFINYIVTIFCIIFYFSLVLIQQKFIRGMVHTRYFCFQQWQFHTTNMDALAGRLCAQDREEFPLNLQQVDWKVHLENCVLGIRENFHKEPPSTLEETRKNLKW
jgi:alcohol-forming fatty acyl-CoA reductase